MRRRDFVALLGGLAAAAPYAAFAQADRTRTVGVLMMWGSNLANAQEFVANFVQRLNELGWADGRNVKIEYRWAGDDVARARAYAKELVDLKPAVIVSQNTPTTVALMEQTKNVPIIFINAVDPVGSRFVASLARPGGNVTGFQNFEFTMGGKWIQLLKEVAPQVTRVALVYSPKTAPFAGAFLKEVEAMAPSFGVKPLALPLNDASETENALAGLAREPGGGLVILPDAFTTANSKLIAELAVKYRLPAVYPYRLFAAAGGLVSFGNVPQELYRQSAVYVDRILKGAKPAELPVQAPTTFSLTVNLKAAKAIGLRVPTTLLARADEVIE